MVGSNLRADAIRLPWGPPIALATVHSDRSASPAMGDSSLVTHLPNLYSFFFPEVFARGYQCSQEVFMSTEGVSPDPQAVSIMTIECQALLFVWP